MTEKQGTKKRVTSCVVSASEVDRDTPIDVGRFQLTILAAAFVAATSGAFIGCEDEASASDNAAADSTSNPDHARDANLDAEPPDDADEDAETAQNEDVSTDVDGFVDEETTVSDTDDEEASASDVSDEIEAPAECEGDQPFVDCPCDGLVDWSHCGPLDSSWPVFGGNAQHTGRIDVPFFEDYSLDWSVPVPRFSYAGVVVGPDGLVVGASSETSTGEHVYAIEADGDGLWDIEIPATVDEELFYGIDMSPALSADGWAYWGSQSGHFVGVDIAAGSVEIIKRPLLADDPFAASFFRSSPIIDQAGALYVMASAPIGVEGGLLKLTPNGTVLWVAPYGGDGSPALNHDGQIVAAGGGMIVVIDRHTGDLIDSYEPRGGMLYGSPAIDDDGNIYVATGIGLVAVDADLNLLWESEEVVSRSTPAIGSEHIYIIDFDGYLRALDKTTGAPLWSHDIGEGSDRNRAQPAVDPCDNVAVASTGGNLAVLRSNGDPMFETTFEGGALTGPAVGPDGAIYVRGYSVFAYRGTTPSSCQ